MRKKHRFKSNPISAPSRKRGQTKRVRQGARHPGSTAQGSIRRPF